jgi:hypothetical protein
VVDEKAERVIREPLATPKHFECEGGGIVNRKKPGLMAGLFYLKVQKGLFRARSSH